MEAFTHVLRCCQSAFGLQAFRSLLMSFPQASPPTEMGLSGELSQLFYHHVSFKLFRFCPLVFLLTGRMLAP